MSAPTHPPRGGARPAADLIEDDVADVPDTGAGGGRPRLGGANGGGTHHASADPGARASAYFTIADTGVRAIASADAGRVLGR